MRTIPWMKSRTSWQWPLVLLQNKVSIRISALDFTSLVFMIQAMAVMALQLLVSNWQQEDDETCPLESMMSYVSGSTSYTVNAGCPSIRHFEFTEASRIQNCYALVGVSDGATIPKLTAFSATWSP